MQLNVYLTFNGNCREAFDFYRSIFGGEFMAVQTFGEGPPDMQVPDNIKDRVMHVSLPVGSSTLMGSDSFTDEPAPAGFSIAVNPDSREQCDTLFAKLSANGEVTMELQETFWGAYFGTCKDKFGINWMLNHELAQQ